MARSRSALFGKVQDEEDKPLPPTTVLPFHRRLHPLGGTRSCEEEQRNKRMMKALRRRALGAQKGICQ